MPLSTVVYAFTLHCFTHILSGICPRTVPLSTLHYAFGEIDRKWFAQTVHELM